MNDGMIKPELLQPIHVTCLGVRFRVVPADESPVVDVARNSVFPLAHLRVVVEDGTDDGFPKIGAFVCGDTSVLIRELQKALETDTKIRAICVMKYLPMIRGDDYGWFVHADADDTESKEFHMSIIAGDTNLVTVFANNPKIIH